MYTCIHIMYTSSHIDISFVSSLSIVIFAKFSVRGHRSEDLLAADVGAESSFPCSQRVTSRFASPQVWADWVVFSSHS